MMPPLLLLAAGAASALALEESGEWVTVWDAEQEKWYVSIVDVVAVLTDSIDANAYWRKLKQRLKAEGMKP